MTRSDPPTTGAADPQSPLRLLLGGDVMLGRLVTRVLASEGMAYPFAALAPLIAQADLFVVNLECAMSAVPRQFAGAAKAFYFRAEPDAVQVLTSARIGLVSLANNHVLDAGEQGLDDTLEVLARHGIASVGAGTGVKAAAAAGEVDVRGQRVGVLAVCDHQADFAATDQRRGIHYLDLGDEQVRLGLVERVRTEAPRFDHLVVSMHWLPNWVPAIPVQYRELADALVHAGARVVWGHSPHHILGTQCWPGGVALYSTGDLIDDYAIDPAYRNDRQVLYLLELARGGIRRVQAHPISLGIGCAAPAEGDARRWIEARLGEACAAVGSEVVMGAGGALEIRAASAGGAHAAARAR